MATTVSAKVNAAAVKSAMARAKRKYVLNPTTPSQLHYITYDRSLSAAEVSSFDGAGDYLELFTFPSNCYLVSYSVTVPDMDSHATPTITLDVMAGSTVLSDDSTAAKAGGTITGTPTGIQDVSDTLFKLKIETGPATAKTSYASAFSVKALVYIGTPAVL